MKPRLFSTAIVLSTAIFCSDSMAVGFQLLTVTDEGQPDLTVGLWYPSNAPNAKEPNTPFDMALAVDAPIQNANGALILISHGFGGWYAGHADTAIALAEAGYIVAAPTHTGNTWSDMSSPVEKWLLDRPRHISKVIDHLLLDGAVSTHVDKEKIGLFGFSAGGYTAVGLIGGVPDIEHARKHCLEYPAEFVCAEGLIDGMLNSGMDTLPDNAWGADQRIKAASIAAPAGAFAYPASSLVNVNADVQLWSAQFDHSVPSETNAALLADRLPASPETHWIENANHFAFLITPCREAFKREDPEEYKLVCEDMPEFDRYAFHRDMNAKVVSFYNHKLGLVQ